MVSKKRGMIVFFMLVVVGTSLPLMVLATDNMGHHVKTHEQQVESKSNVAKTATAVEVGNKACPVTGSPVTDNEFVEYKGKRYGICCAACKKSFLKNPVKYIKQLMGH